MSQMSFDEVIQFIKDEKAKADCAVSQFNPITLSDEEELSYLDGKADALKDLLDKLLSNVNDA
jgi:hypothetical protein